MKGIKQSLLVIASTTALIIVGFFSYFLVVHPSLISLITFALFVPVFSILGLGFFRIARNWN
ncbi:MAG TPA: hypothetical protein VII39_15145 [Bradyrhizobium sp.]